MMRFMPRQSGAGIVLSDSAVMTMDVYRQTGNKDKEAGGQLFARFDGADTVIDIATPPKWLDKRSRYRFEPSKWMQQREIAAMHAKGLHFVGDWHSHPEPIPRPSELDLASMHDCFVRSHHELRAFVLVIVGTQAGPEGFYVALIEKQAHVQLHVDATASALSFGV